MDKQTAAADIDYITGIMRRTHARIDTHAFHNVHWGLIVLVWYPLSNWFWHQGYFKAMIGLGIGSVVLGMVLSGVREAMLARKPRLEGENTFISKQVIQIVYACIIAGAALSAVGPAFRFIEGENVPIVWGFVYANMAFMLGVVYTREYLWAGAVIFAGCILAIALPYYNGYILGPFMGLGLIIPGTMGERRVRKLIEADA